MLTVIVIALAVVMVLAAVMVAVRVRRGEGAPDATAAAPDGTVDAAGGNAAGGDAPRDPVAKLVLFLRRRPWARRALSGLSVVLLLGAAAMIGYPYFTNLYQDRVQSNLDSEFASGDLRQKYQNRAIGEGDALTRLQIPSIDVDVVVVEGVTASALRAGAGHYPNTPLPCEVGNVAVAGHRTTFGRPFHSLDRLSNGDTVILETPIGTCTYQITVEPFVVTPDRVDVVSNTPDEAVLTLTTCHPKGSARERLVVHATMVSSEFFEA